MMDDRRSGGSTSASASPGESRAQKRRTNGGLDSHNDFRHAHGSVRPGNSGGKGSAKHGPYLLQTDRIRPIPPYTFEPAKVSHAHRDLVPCYNPGPGNPRTAHHGTHAATR